MKPTYKNIIAFLWTRDLPKARKFYIEVLGLKKSFEADGWCELGVPGANNAYLALNRWVKDEPIPENNYITLGISDLTTFHQGLLDAGVKLKGDIIEFDQGMRMLKFFDPDGNIITVAEA